MTEIHKPGTGAIFGIVTEEGVAKDNSPVYLYDMRRWEGAGKKKILARRFTRPDGGFEFAGLNTNYGDYMVMVTDEDGADPKNALVQDRVNPIPAHAGSGQLSEWYVRAMKDGAQAGWLAWPTYADGSGEPTPRGLFTRPFQNTVNPVTWPPNPDAPPEIPNMAAAQANPLGWGFITAGRRIGVNFDMGASLEMLIDLDTIATQAGESFFVAATAGSAGDNLTFSGSTWSSLSGYSHDGAGGGPNSVPRIVVGILPDKTVRLYMPDATAWPWSSNRILGWPHSQVLRASFDLSAQTGVAHLIVSFTPSDAFRLYVDGQLFGAPVATSLAGVPVYSGSLYSFLGVSSGMPTGNLTSAFCSLRSNARSYMISLLVQYDRPLTAAQVLDHYKALYDNDLVSPVSGYAREVFKDTPVLYWRMDDFEVDTRTSFASEVNWRDPNTGEGHHSTRLNLVGNSTSVDPFVPSPVVGRSTVGVVSSNGNRFENAYASMFGWPFRDRGSFSCWAKFDVATPAAEEFIAEFDLTGSTTSFFEVARTTGNRLRVGIREGGTLNSYTFADYVPPDSVWQHINITIDKTGEIDPVNGLLKLYVGDESTTPTLVQTIFIPLTSLYTSLEFPNVVNSGGTTFRAQTHWGLTGSVCELAVFPETLTPERIEAHWNARTVV